jgi:hypothetical protein
MEASNLMRWTACRKSGHNYIRLRWPCMRHLELPSTDLTIAVYAPEADAIGGN